MFNKLILNEDLNEMLGDYVEIIENIDFCGDDDDYFQDEKFTAIDNFCCIHNCEKIVNDYGVIRAIKLNNDTFGCDIDFEEPKFKINQKLAFVIIYDFLHFVDLNFYKQFIQVDCNILLYIDDNENIIEPIESGIKNYMNNYRFYPIF